MRFGDATRLNTDETRVLNLSKNLLWTFLLHASIARPMGESGKLKLTSDMTQLEMGLASLLTTGQIQGARGGMRVDRVGKEYMALRSFRYVPEDFLAGGDDVGELDRQSVMTWPTSLEKFSSQTSPLLRIPLKQSISLP